MPSGIEDLEGYAVRAANEAVKYDKQGLKTKAIERYDEAIRLLMKLAEFVESPEIRTIYLEKAQKYRRRVEALKSNVDVAYAATATFHDLSTQLLPVRTRYPSAQDSHTHPFPLLPFRRIRLKGPIPASSPHPLTTAAQTARCNSTQERPV